MLNAKRTEARVRARPIRVAYLVPEAETSHNILDAVFAASMGLWGGRYHVVVPCVGNVPRAEYIPWMEAYDPDIIYSYVELDQAVIDGLNERFGPSFAVVHKTRAEDNHPRRFSPNFPVEILTCLSVAPQYARAFPVSAPKPMFIVDYLRAEPVDRFIGDNLGAPETSFSYWPLPDNLADVVRPLYLGSEEAQKKQRGQSFGETVCDVPTLLRTMAARHNIFGLSNLAADSAPRLEVRERFREGFTLVVGDSFADRVIHWNERSRTSAHLGRDFTGLIVSPSRLENPEFFSAVLEFINKRNHIRPQNNSPLTCLMSASLSPDDLEKIRARFAAAKSWNMFHVDQQHAAYSPPSADALVHGGELVSGRSFDWSDPSKTFSVNDGELRLGDCRPEPLVGVTNPSRATMGMWALDVHIERENTVSPYSNVTHTWRLPRRLRMHPAFREPYQPAGGTGHWFPRSGRRGNLVLAGCFNQELPPVTIPDDESAFRVALTQAKRWLPNGPRDVAEEPFVWIRPSDKGRYLMTTLKLFGGLFEASSVLLHEFWKATFAELGAAMGDERHEAIIARLKKRLAGTALNSAGGMERVAEVVAQEAYQVRVPALSVRFDELVRRHQPFLVKEKEELIKHQTDEPQEWIERAVASLPASVQALCGRGVLFQGYEWLCRTCYNRNWHDISALSKTLGCSVCGAKWSAPVDEPWHFRLDGFVRDALREHGVLPLVWCLTRLARDSRETFYFLGPHELFLKYSEPAVTCDHELDALAVVGGRVHLCEAKTSARSINLKSLVEVAKRIRPDVVTLAVMEASSPRLEGSLADLKTALAGTGIDAQLLSLESDDFSADVYLPD